MFHLISVFNWNCKASEAFQFSSNNSEKVTGENAIRFSHFWRPQFTARQFPLPCGFLMKTWLEFFWFYTVQQWMPQNIEKVCSCVLKRWIFSAIWDENRRIQDGVDRVWLKFWEILEDLTEVKVKVWKFDGCCRFGCRLPRSPQVHYVANWHSWPQTQFCENIFSN